MTLPWPEQYAAIESKIISFWDTKRKVEILREFSEGKSLAKVYLVDIEGRNHSGLAILKLDTPERGRDYDRNEADRFAQAIQSSPEYAEKHLPQLMDICSHEDQVALLYSAAGGRFTDTVALHTLEAGQQLAAARRVAIGILEEWNKDYEVEQSPRLPSEALVHWLGYRIRPELGGRIHNFLEEECGLDTSERAFSFLGYWFPNPCTYAMTPDVWSPREGIMLVKGKSHGDLHRNNILIKLKGPYDFDYYLIDLALYEENTYLFFDHAYLELSHLLHHRGNVQFSRWLQILEALTGAGPMDVDTTKGELDDSGLLYFFRAVRKEIRKWIISNELGRQDHLEGQALLARVAVGLNFVHRVTNISVKERQLALLYAAAHLKQYFSVFNVQWEQQGPVLDFKELIEPPKTDDWRAVWNACEQFDRHKNVYILVSGPDVRQVDPVELQILGRISWSLVFDFDPNSKRGGLLNAVRPTLQKHRYLHETLPDNLLEINYQEATCWLMAAGLIGREDTLKADFDTWRRQYLPAIRELAHRVRKSVSPQPVLILIMHGGLTKEYLRATWEGLDEVFTDDAHHVIVHHGEIDLENLSGKPGVALVRCPLQNLMSGLWQMYGGTPDTEQIRIPGRGVSEEERTPIFLTEEDYQYLKEDLEVVHWGLVEEPQKGRRVGHDFWRGHKITWKELDMGADVQRDLAEPLKNEIITGLRKSRTISITVPHVPGSGGTTIARRIAWDLKDLYPSVLIHHLSPHTASRIERLFQLTRLPVLVVIEAADVSPPVREHLYKELKGRNTRAVLLYVVRSLAPSGKFSLQDPMVEQEVNRFYERYRNIALSGRERILGQLAHDDNMRPYRSPFFFGLYAFEEEFVHVPDYVRAHLDSLTPESREIMLFLALVTRFSQSSLRDVEIKRLLNLPTSKPFRLDEVLGDGPSGLVLHRDQEVRIVHPIIALEILKQLLTPSNPGNQDVWKTGLVDLCYSFIESLVKIAGPDSTSILGIFTQMFITRDPWEERPDRRRHFSELILIMPETSQHRVLTKLKDCCPNEAHFWNHLGRHHIYVMHSRYEEAENCLMKAIALDPENGVHHHALGLAYRYEIRKQLSTFIQQRATAEKGLTAISDLVDKANACFEQARKLDPESEYGYITDIQLLTEIIQQLFRLSNFQDYAQFLSSVEPAATWCREKLPLAEELLRQVKALQAQENLSRLTVECEATVLNFYGRFDSMIQSLQNLLQRADIQRQPIRRVMANAYYAHRHYDWKAMKARDLHKIYTLMAANLEEDPTNALDLRMWFQAYRRLRNFDILEAIDRLTGWAIREESIEAHYYLYILHFLRWKQGILEDHRLVTDHIRKCQVLAGKLRRIHSFEWLAKEPAWCPLTHQSELGNWNDDNNFYENIDPLALVEGTVKRIRGPQAGHLALGPLDVFFHPLNEFLPAKDENVDVQFNLGFSYDGLRGWSVKRIGR